MPALMVQRSSAMRNEIRRELERRRKAINVAKGRVVKRSSAAPPPPRLISSVSGAAAATIKLADAPPREAVARKWCAPPPHPRVLATPGAATKKIAYLDMGEAPRRCTAPSRREALIPFAMKVGKSNAPTASAAATKLSVASSHETTGAETEYVKKPSSSAPIKKPSSMLIKKPSSAPIQPRSSSILVKKGMTVKVRVPAGTLPNGQRLVIWHPSVVVSDAEDGYVEVIYKGNYPRDRTAVRIALDQVKNMPSAK